MVTLDFAVIKRKVLDKICPTIEERKKLEDTANSLKKNIENIINEMNLQNISVKLVGSAARNTWISGNHDLDLFIMFPASTTRAQLEKLGLLIARRIAIEGDFFEERYAEHPYINVKYNGFDVDIVPCFKVKSASCILSAVDRTPFHNEFIKMHINGLESEVLMLKQFTKGTKVYGSELKTMGFSGYLIELLIIHYGSFEDVIHNACNWEPGKYIDIQCHGIIKHKEPLIVIDPTDPKRNVAAALSLDKFCIFIDKCRKFIEKPDLTFFFPSHMQCIDEQTLKKRLATRQTTFLAISFEKPDVIDDVLYPQLYKMEQSVTSLLKDFEFEVINIECWSGEKTGLLLELLNSQLPTLKKHRGPPVWIRTHAETFRKKYEHMSQTFGFYIENGMYVVEIPRKYNDAYTLLNEKLASCSLGKNISIAVKNGYMIYINEDIFNIKDHNLKMLLEAWPEKLDITQ